MIADFSSMKFNCRVHLKLSRSSSSFAVSCRGDWVQAFLYSCGQTKTTILVIMIWGPCTTLNSTFYCINVEIRTQCFDFHKPIFQNWNKKFCPQNIGQTLTAIFVLIDLFWKYKSQFGVHYLVCIQSSTGLCYTTTECYTFVPWITSTYSLETNFIWSSYSGVQKEWRLCNFLFFLRNSRKLL